MGDFDYPHERVGAELNATERMLSQRGGGSEGGVMD